MRGKRTDCPQPRYTYNKRTTNPMISMENLSGGGGDLHIVKQALRQIKSHPSLQTGDSFNIHSRLNK